MEEINWEPTIETIKEQELTEEEKKVAKICSETELEFNETIQTIKHYNNKNNN